MRRMIDADLRSHAGQVMPWLFADPVLNNVASGTVARFATRYAALSGVTAEVVWRNGWTGWTG